MLHRMEHDLLTPKEASPVLRRSPVVIRRDLAAGRLPGVRIGGRWFMRREDINALIGRQEAS